MTSTTQRQDQQDTCATSATKPIVLNNIAFYDIKSTHPFGRGRKDIFDKAIEDLTTNLKAIQHAIQMKKERAEGELHWLHLEISAVQAWSEYLEEINDPGYVKKDYEARLAELEKLVTKQRTIVKNADQAALVYKREYDACMARLKLDQKYIMDKLLQEN